MWLWRNSYLVLTDWHNRYLHWQYCLCQHFPIQATIVPLTGTGTFTLEITKNGDDIYFNAQKQTITIQLEKKPLILVPSDPPGITAAIGDQMPSLEPEAQIINQGDGLVSGDVIPTELYPPQRRYRNIQNTSLLVTVLMWPLFYTIHSLVVMVNRSRSIAPICHPDPLWIHVHRHHHNLLKQLNTRIKIDQTKPTVNIQIPNGWSSIKKTIDIQASDLTSGIDNSDSESVKVSYFDASNVEHPISLNNRGDLHFECVSSIHLCLIALRWLASIQITQHRFCFMEVTTDEWIKELYEFRAVSTDVESRPVSINVYIDKERPQPPIISYVSISLMFPASSFVLTCISYSPAPLILIKSSMEK